MPLDDSIPFRALAGMQRAETYDPLAVQEQINRNQVLQGAAQKAQQEMQSQQRLQQLAQQYGDDYDGLISAVAKEGFPDKALALSEAVGKSRYEGAQAHLAQTKDAEAEIDSWQRLLQATDEKTWAGVRNAAVAKMPQLGSVLPPEYSDQAKQQALSLGMSAKDWAKTQSEASQLYLDGKTQLSAARLLAGADAPQKRQIADGLLKQAGLGQFSQMWASPQEAQAFIDAQAKAESDKLQSPEVEAIKAWIREHNGQQPTQKDLEQIHRGFKEAGTIVRVGDSVAPADVAGSVRTTLSGKKYLDMGDFETPKERGAARAQAQKAGVMAVDKETGKSLRAIDSAKQNAMAIWRQISPLLAKDSKGRIISGPGNTIGKMFQTHPELGSYGSWRTSAIQQVQALAEPGMGLRINQAEINAAMENDIPQLTDDIPTAAMRLKNLFTMLNNKENDALTRDRSSLMQGPSAPATNPFLKK